MMLLTQNFTPNNFYNCGFTFQHSAECWNDLNKNPMRQLLPRKNQINNNASICYNQAKGR